MSNQEPKRLPLSSLKEMIDAGSSISVRIIAEDSATDISKLL